MQIPFVSLVRRRRSNLGHEIVVRLDDRRFGNELPVACPSGLFCPGDTDSKVIPESMMNIAYPYWIVHDQFNQILAIFANSGRVGRLSLLVE
jgi:hypothetical protein